MNYYTRNHEMARHKDECEDSSLFLPKLLDLAVRETIKLLMTSQRQKLLIRYLLNMEQWKSHLVTCIMTSKLLCNSRWHAISGFHTFWSAIL